MLPKHNVRSFLLQISIYTLGCLCISSNKALSQSDNINLDPPRRATRGNLSLLISAENKNINSKNFDRPLLSSSRLIKKAKPSDYLVSTIPDNLLSQLPQNRASVLNLGRETKLVAQTEQHPAKIPEPESSEIDTPPSENTPHSETEKAPTQSKSEPRVLLAEVVVEGTESELIDIVYETISSKPGETTTRSQLQEDVNAIYATGFFQNVEVAPSDTSLGVRITFVVEANPILNKVAVITVPQRQASEVLPPEKITEFFGQNYGQILNLRELQQGIIKVNQWYSNNGYELAQVVGSPDVSPNGEVSLIVAEGVIEKIQVRFFDEDDEATEGKTLDFVITREMELRSGDVFKRDTAQKDLERVFGLGIFDDARFSFSPGSDPSKVIVNIDVVEGSTGSIAAGGGYDSSKGIIFSLSYEESNLNGRNQKAVVDMAIAESIFSLDTSLTSSGDPKEDFKIDPLSIAGIAALDALSEVDSALQKELVEAIQNPERLQKLFSHIQDINSGSESLLEIIAPVENSIAVEKYLKSLRIAEETNQEAKAALTLNNLGNLYYRNKDYEYALDTYSKAQKKFQELDSHALELVTYLRIAAIYRITAQPSKAITNYYKALEILKSLDTETKLEVIFGNEVFNVLNQEWQINDEHLNTNTTLIKSLVKLTLLFDIAATYSTLGDYQQSLYIIESPQFLEVTKKLSASKSRKNFNNLTSELISKLENDFEDENEDDLDNPKEIGNELIETIKSLKEKLILLIEDSPELTQEFALKFIYSDINNDTLANLYQTSIQKKYDDLTNFFISEVSQILDELFIYTDFIAEIEDVDLKNFWVAAAKLLSYSTNDLTEVNNSSDLILPIDAEKQLDQITDSLTNLLSKHEKEIFTSEELAEFKPILNSILYSTLQLIKESINSNSSNDIITNKAIINISQSILAKWSNNNKIFQKFEWIKSYIYYMQGDSYDQLGEYQNAAKFYELYFKFHQKIESKALVEFLKQTDIKSDEISYFKDYIPFLEQFDKTLKINTHTKVAKIYQSLEEPLQSKFHYKKALSLSQELFEENSIFALEEVTIAEIYYGIALANFLLKDFKNAQKEIETAIYINDNFFPKELSSEIGFTSISLQYGYGKPNRGNFYSGFNISSYNPWTNPELFSNKPLTFDDSEDIFDSPFFKSETDDLEQATCNTPANYFTCRQRYFDLYIDILLNLHQEDSLENFNVLAFEASERARVKSSKIFQNLNNSTDNNAENSWLNQRRNLLITSTSLEEIQKEVLDDDTVILEYFLGEEKSYLWLVRNNQPIQTFELPARSIIEKKAEEFSQLLTFPTGRVKPKTTARVGQELSEMILGQVVHQLSQKRLLIVADGLLQYLPFNVLPNLAPETISSESALQGEFAPVLNPLLLDHEIVMLPSASSLVALRQTQDNRVQPTREITLFADPVFNHEDERVKQVRIAGDFQPIEKEYLNSSEALYSRLPNSVNELDFIGDLKISKKSREMVQGFDASLQSLLESNVGTSKIVHFATHGIFNTNSPERSGIVLSSLNERGELQPGLLSPSFAFNDINLASTELVVLSGCRTALSSGQINREGLTGLTGGLFAAGADQIIASLWSVEDEATRKLMSHFYNYLLNSEASMSPSQALRQAQLDMWNDPKWQTPYNWSAFIIQGEWKNSQ